MNTRKLLIASCVALLPMAGALAGYGSKDTDASAASVAALKQSLPSTAGFKVDQVRVTDSGVTCIDYRVSNDQGGESRAHAVVQGDEVLRSTMGNKKFEKAWGDHCLGPRGGMTNGN
jgi:hypothetical protein